MIDTLCTRTFSRHWISREELKHLAAIVYTTDWSPNHHEMLRTMGRLCHRVLRETRYMPSLKCECGRARGVENKRANNRALRLRREIETMAGHVQTACSVAGCQRDAARGYVDPDWGRVCHSHGMTLRKRRERGTDIKKPLRPLSPTVTAESEVRNRDVWLRLYRSLTPDEWREIWVWAMYPAGKWRPRHLFAKARAAVLESLADCRPDYEAIHQWLKERGWVRYAVAASGSSYYYTMDGMRLRLSDHETNQPEEGRLELRADNPRWEEAVVQFECEHERIAPEEEIIP